MKTKTLSTIVVVSLLLLALPLGAQVTGTISGVITDATQSGVSGATVTVTSAETGAKIGRAHV